MTGMVRTPSNFEARYEERWLAAAAAAVTATITAATFTAAAAIAAAAAAAASALSHTPTSSLLPASAPAHSTGPTRRWARRCVYSSSTTR